LGEGCPGVLDSQEFGRPFNFAGSPSTQSRLTIRRPIRFRYGHFSAFLPKQFLQHANALVHMLFFQQKRRQEAEDFILGDIKKYSFRQPLLDDWPRRNVEHQALNETSSSRFDGRCILVNQAQELFMEIAAHFQNVLHQPLFFKDGKVFEANATGERTTSERRAVLPGRNRGGELLLGQKCSQRNSGGDRLGDGDDVWSHTKTLEGEDFPGASQSALDFIEDERSVMLIGKRS